MYKVDSDKSELSTKIDSDWSEIALAPDGSHGAWWAMAPDGSHGAWLAMAPDGSHGAFLLVSVFTFVSDVFLDLPGSLVPVEYSLYRRVFVLVFAFVFLLLSLLVLLLIDFDFSTDLESEFLFKGSVGRHIRIALYL